MFHAALCYIIGAMRALAQRVTRASVMVDGAVVGAIGNGLLVLLGVHESDDETAARWLAEKTAALRIFNDCAGKMNLSLHDTGGAALVISQFTLYADTRRGNRPGFAAAARGAAAQRLYEKYVAALRDILGAARVATGIFAAVMQVELVNDGPVTILLENRATASCAGL